MCMQTGADPELSLRGYLIYFIIFSCGKFFDTVVYCRKYNRLEWAMASWPSLDPSVCADRACKNKFY